MWLYGGQKFHLPAWRGNDYDNFGDPLPVIYVRQKVRDLNASRAFTCLLNVAVSCDIT